MRKYLPWSVPEDGWQWQELMILEVSCILKQIFLTTT